MIVKITVYWVETLCIFTPTFRRHMLPPSSALEVVNSVAGLLYKKVTRSMGQRAGIKKETQSQPMGINGQK
jgi:hypothetical protein